MELFCDKYRQWRFQFKVPIVTGRNFQLMRQDRNVSFSVERSHPVILAYTYTKFPFESKLEFHISNMIYCNSENYSSADWLKPSLMLHSVTIETAKAVFTSPT